MERLVWLVESEDSNENWHCFVRATYNQIDERKYKGDFLRFGASPWCDSKDCPRGQRIKDKYYPKYDGEKVLSLREFDKVLHEHHCDTGSWDEMMARFGFRS